MSTGAGSSDGVVVGCGIGMVLVGVVVVVWCGDDGGGM